ncbi:unnamed protein product [Cylindrotheca closterium]|uniref:BD-FAE-like domain-containing protein n=1 Tax=Cylindrotheca closterium TaxID=2856 RepID=A0AAD2JGI0_9STRA|nr:unnamed protein product [Cylindrotheca closterium]
MLATIRGFTRLASLFAILLILTCLPCERHYAEAFSVQTTTAKVENTVNELLQQAPDYEPSPDDDFFRNFRTRVPRRIQYFLRDFGILRFVVDTMTLIAAAPAVLEEQPIALTQFVHSSGLQGSLLSKLVNRKLKSDISMSQDFLEPAVAFQRLQYGKDRRQILDLIQCKRENTTSGSTINTSKRLVLFVHGGAWGRPIASPFLQENIDVAIVGYRTYPNGNVSDQAADIVASLSKLKHEGLIDAKTDITLMGHSSGSHIAAMALLTDPEFRQSIDSFVALNGVYDIPKHYLFERARGVERISPMAVACSIPLIEESAVGKVSGSLRENWKSQSPTWLILRQPSKSTLMDSFPDTLIVHGKNDTTVPMESSIRLWESLNKSAATQQNSRRIDLEVLPEVEHLDSLIQIMFGGITRDTVLKWMQESSE